jgi:hypothetical protein
MKVLILQDDLFEYLNHIVRSYAAAGIPPEEGLALYHLHVATKTAQTVADTQVAKVATGEVAGAPVVAVTVDQTEREFDPNGQPA